MHRWILLAALALTPALGQSALPATSGAVQDQQLRSLQQQAQRLTLEQPMTPADRSSFEQLWAQRSQLARQARLQSLQAYVAALQSGKSVADARAAGRAAVGADGAQAAQVRQGLAALAQKYPGLKRALKGHRKHHGRHQRDMGRSGHGTRSDSTTPSGK